MGRFTSPDPLYWFRPRKGADDPKRLALYPYVANDPVDNIDRSGLSFWSVFGAIVGVIVGIVVVVVVVAAFASGIGFGLLALAGLIAVVTATYLGTNAADADSGFGEFMRGFLIGLNAGMNAVCATVLFGPVVGVALGVINFLAAFDRIAELDV